MEEYSIWIYPAAGSGYRGSSCVLSGFFIAGNGWSKREGVRSSRAVHVRMHLEALLDMSPRTAYCMEVLFLIRTI
jgi:hypothetical protein